MKMFLPMVALGMFGLGFVLGGHSSRYEHVKVGQYSARFDRWRGRLELISISATKELAANLSFPTPTPSPWTDFKTWGAGDLVVTPTPEK